GAGAPARRVNQKRSGWRVKTASALTSAVRGGVFSDLAVAGSDLAALAATTARISAVRRLVDAIAPHVVPPSGLPLGGIHASLSVRPDVPLVCSVWGNDFTLHARLNPVVKALTRRALRRADALHSDCNRDVRLALALGFDARRPSVVLPGGGGVSDLFVQAG